MDATDTILKSVARVDAAVNYLTGEHLTAQLIEGMQAAVIRASSPWLNRKDAAEYLRCSPSEIDRAGAQGFVTIYKRGGSTLYRRDELDAAIREGKWKPAK